MENFIGQNIHTWDLCYGLSFGKLVFQNMNIWEGLFIYLSFAYLFSITDILKVSFIKQILFASINIALVYNYHLFSGYQEILIYSLLIYVAKYSYLLIYEKN